MLSKIEPIPVAVELTIVETKNLSLSNWLSKVLSRFSFFT